MKFNLQRNVTISDDLHGVRDAPHGLFHDLSHGHAHLLLPTRCNSTASWPSAAEMPVLPIVIFSSAIPPFQVIGKLPPSYYTIIRPCNIASGHEASCRLT